MVHTRVKEHLSKMQVKQNWLARRMNISESSLSMILAGKRRMTVDELECLCAVLCVPVSTFVKPDELLITVHERDKL